MGDIGFDQRRWIDPLYCTGGECTVRVRVDW